MFERSSGILFHPTSLPGKYGMGELNDYAYQFIDFLANSKQKLWQVLPLGPTGYGDSPYQCFSAFAGNPLLISLDHLVKKGLLSASALKKVPHFATDNVDFGAVIPWKFEMLRQSYAVFAKRATAEQQAQYAIFCNKNAEWLDDYALFMAVKTAHEGRSWNTWSADIRDRTPAALELWRHKLQDQVRFWQYVQWQFFDQWFWIKHYANTKNIKIIGDIPIFVAFDSADAWANREQFFLDETGNPTVIAGVPPDYFSPTGQRWGNPLYRYDIMQTRQFDWWIARVRSALSLYDIVRIDHFRGFEAYWEVPASEPTAMIGKWVKAPGEKLFEAIQNVLAPVDEKSGKRATLPIIAEDLGVITPEVEALRDGFHLPGMRVLQFAFVADTSSNFLPHNYTRNCVAYVGTHDNDTTVGWWRKLESASRQQVLDYLGKASATDADASIHWDMARLLMMSVADTTVLTLQDVLGLDSAARMNMPGKPDGNWAWRVNMADLTPAISDKLANMAVTYGRY
jgi:4-alpha-glucanotransferase